MIHVRHNYVKGIIIGAEHHTLDHSLIDTYLMLAYFWSFYYVNLISLNYAEVIVLKIVRYFYSKQKISDHDKQFRPIIYTVVWGLCFVYSYQVKKKFHTLENIKSRSHNFYYNFI